MQIMDSVKLVLDRKGNQVWSISPDAAVFEAIERMADKNIGALVVLEKEQVIGVISERDYTRKVILKGKSSKETPVREIMSANPLTASPRDTVEECMRAMTEHRVRHMPILEEGQLVGIISIGDLVNWIITAQHQTIDQLHQYITGSYPG